MEVHFTPEQEIRLQELASRAGRDPESLVREAALWWIGERGRFLESVEEGIAQADRGEFVEEEEMDALVNEMLR